MKNNEVNPTFSIIIPVFNGADFITATLDAVAAQTFTDFEIVITNDGSNDDTEMIIMQYIAAYPSLTVNFSSQTNKGIGAARNHAIERSRGKFLAFLDADDHWYTNKLESVQQIIIDFPGVDVIYHDEVEVKADKSRHASRYGKIQEPAAFDDLLFNGNRLSTSATVVQRELAQELGGFSDNLDFNSAEDYEFWLRLAKRGANFYYLPVVLGEYNRIENSVSLRIEYHLANSFQVIRHHLNLMLKEETYDNEMLRKKIDRLPSQQLFSTGRAFFIEKNYKESVRFYKKALQQRIFWFKPYIGLFQSSLFRLAGRLLSK